MSKLYFYSDTSEYSAQSNKPLACMPVRSSSPFISVGRGLLIFPQFVTEVAPELAASL